MTGTIAWLVMLLAGRGAPLQAQVATLPAQLHEPAAIARPTVSANADSAAVARAVERFLDAFNRLDWDAFRASFADDATTFMPMAAMPERRNGREDVEAAFGAFFDAVRRQWAESGREGPPRLSITPRDLRIRMMGDAAIVTFHLGDPDGGSTGRRTLVLEKRNERWLIVHLHASSLERATVAAGALPRDGAIEPESSPPALADTIRTLAVESMTLWNRLDPEAWLALFGDSVRWYHSATSLDRAGVEDMVRGLMSVMRDARYRVIPEPDVLVLGRDAAVASFAMVQAAIGHDGDQLEQPTGLTFVYQRRGGDWKIVRVHESLEPPSDSLVTATVMARTRELADAWERRDADAYLTHFSDDFTFYFEGSRVSRARFEAVVRESIGSLRESTFEILNPAVEALGTGGATISFELREIMVSASGATTELNGVMTLVYERRGGRWLIVRAHESLLQQRER